MTYYKFNLLSTNTTHKTIAQLSKNFKTHAAVLIPIIQFSPVEQHILFTQRSLQLRRNRGEISFPGGLREVADTSLLQTALRETQEEIGILPNKIQILGQLFPVPDRTGKILVHAFVGVLGSLESLKLILNPEEVERVFTVNLSHLINTRENNMQIFRESRLSIPSWPIYIQENQVGMVVDKNQQDVVIWGLTAYLLQDLIKRIHVQCKL